MSNDSSTGGYLVAASNPADDTTLEDLIQAAIVGITGLTGSLVRPRWQAVNPKQLEVSSNWCAFGIVESKRDAWPAFVHDDTVDAGLGADIMYRDEVLSILLSFYGAASGANAKGFVDGLCVSQNLEALVTQNINLVDVDPVTVGVPALINNQWQRRWDVTFRLRRRVTRTYKIRNLVEASGIIHKDSGLSTSFDTGDHE